MLTKRVFRVATALLGALVLLAIIPLLAKGALSERPQAAPARTRDSVEISDIVGAYFDADRGEVVVLGRYDPAYPTMSRDDIRENLATAMRALYNGGSTPYPGMTIEFGPQPGPDLLPVFYFGLITDTQMGWAMFESDRLLKVYSLGEDNLSPGTPYTSSVPGYMSIPDRLVALQDTYTGTVDPQRFFFTPSVNLRLTADETGVIFSDTQAVLNWRYIPEDTPYTSTNSTLAAQGFVDHFNAHYDEFAQEQWGRDDTALKELVQLFKLNGVAKWLRDKDIEDDLPGSNGTWMDVYPIRHTETPTYTPGITVTRSFTVSTGGSSYYTQYISIYGGVDGSIPNDYQPDDPLAQLIIDEAENERDQADEWPVPDVPDPRPTDVDGPGQNSASNVQLWALAIKLAEILLQNGGFESGPPGDPWVQYSSGGFQLITDFDSHSGTYEAYFGGYANGTEYLYQDIIVPADGEAWVSYWWGVSTFSALASYPDLEGGVWDLRHRPAAPLAAEVQSEVHNPKDVRAPNDFFYVEVLDTGNNLLETLEVLSNESPTGMWYSSSWDLSAYAGQTIRLRFRCTTDGQSPVTGFSLDDVRLEFGDFSAPGVSDVSISPAPPLGKVTAQFEITFSEEMYRFRAPAVSMGLVPPYDAYTLTPRTDSGYRNGFLEGDPTRWQGVYTFTAGMPDGTYHLSVGGAEDVWHNALITDTSHTFQVEIPPSEGPTFGALAFSSSTLYNKLFTVTVEISDAGTGDHGVTQATLYYGYDSPYAQNSVGGSGPGSNGDGTWTFVLPAQGETNVDRVLRFYIQAWDGDMPQSNTVLNNGGRNYSVLITQYSIYLPLLVRNP